MPSKTNLIRQLWFVTEAALLMRRLLLHKPSIFKMDFGRSLVELKAGLSTQPLLQLHLYTRMFEGPMPVWRHCRSGHRIAHPAL